MPSVQGRNLRFQILTYIYIYTFPGSILHAEYVTRVLNTASSDFVFDYSNVVKS